MTFTLEVMIRHWLFPGSDFNFMFSKSEVAKQFTYDGQVRNLHRAGQNQPKYFKRSLTSKPKLGENVQRLLTLLTD